MTRELETIVESIIFASPEGATTREITRCVRGAASTAAAAVRGRDGGEVPEAVLRFAKADEEQVTAAIARLNTAYEETGRAFLLVERPAGWRIMSRAEFGPWVRELFPDKKPSRLTPSALETLAIIAYRQPVTKGGLEAVRGVSVDGPLQALLDRNVVRIAGRADLPGRPLLYETTDLFLEHFGIRTVDELPNAAELRGVKLPEPEPITPPDPAASKAPASPAAESDGDPAPAASGTEEPGAKPKRKEKTKKGKSAAAPAAAPETEAIPAPEPSAEPVAETAAETETETAAESEPAETEAEAEAETGTEAEAGMDLPPAAEISPHPRPPAPEEERRKPRVPKTPAAARKKSAPAGPVSLSEFPDAEFQSGSGSGSGSDSGSRAGSAPQALTGSGAAAAASAVSVVPDAEWSPAEDEPEPDPEEEDSGDDSRSLSESD